jgi:hypothetical protein
MGLPKTPRILIAGGYGHVGSNIAAHIRKKYPNIELILCGRHPEKGEQLAIRLGNAESKYLDLTEDFNLSSFGDIDLIIAALQDPENVLIEAAIAHGLAHISITKLADELAPVIFLLQQGASKSRIVLADHWQAGILTLVAKDTATQFSKIDHMQTACLYDTEDPIGPMIAAQLDSFVGRALLRRNRKWEWLDATENVRSLDLSDGSSIDAYPMGTLDVPSLAAISNSPNVRFDISIGKSIGSSKGEKASHDLYIDIEGTLLSGEPAKIRTIVSDPEGQSHLTALGALLATEAVLGLGGHSATEKGGLYLPETIVSTPIALARLKEFGVIITQINL